MSMIAAGESVSQAFKFSCIYWFIKGPVTAKFHVPLSRVCSVLPKTQVLSSWQQLLCSFRTRCQWPWLCKTVGKPERRKELQLFYFFFPAGHQTEACKVLVTSKQSNHCFDNSHSPTHSCSSHWSCCRFDIWVWFFINSSPRKRLSVWLTHLRKEKMRSSYFRFMTCKCKKKKVLQLQSRVL